MTAKKIKNLNNFKGQNIIIGVIALLLTIVVGYIGYSNRSLVRNIDQSYADTLIVQDNFELGIGNWLFYTNGTGTMNRDGVGPTGGKAVKISLSSVGSNTQFYTSGLALKPNTNYRLQLYAYSNSGNNFEVSVHKHTSPYTNFGLDQQVVDIGNSWKQYTINFTTNSQAGTGARLRFWFATTAKSGDIYFLDNISLAEISASSPISTPVSTPVSTPQNPPSTSFSIVDPVHWTDAYVNSFIKEQVRQGNKRIAGAGTWWGPTDRFFDNQIWAINRSITQNTQLERGTTLNQSVACLLPGKVDKNLPGDRPRNEIDMLSTNNLSAAIPTISERSTTISGLEIFQTIGTQLKYARDVPSHVANGDTAGPAGYAYLVNCQGQEGLENQFGDGTPDAGTEIHTQVRQIAWIGREPSANGDGYWNFQDMPTLSTPLFATAWYEGITYVLGGIDRATSDNKGTMTAYQLVGAEIKGNLTVHQLAQRIRTKAADAKSELHHLELRIEQNNKDYTVDKTLLAPNADGLGVTASRYFTLDTRKVSDGWHILSAHFHIIDHQSSGNFQGKQLAGELKIPICINNSGQTNCN